MKRNFIGALLALFLFFTAGARAAYAPAVVSADARWVVFADFNALRASALGQELVTLVESAQKEATGGTIGVDFPKLLATIGTVTAYGTNFVPDPQLMDGTLIVQGTADMRKIAESVLLQGTLAEPKVFSEVAGLPFAAYAIADPNSKEADKTQLVVAFPPEPIVLASKSKAQLLKARDVFRGAAASLARSGSPLAKLPAGAEGAYLYTASLVPAEGVGPQNTPHARILQLTHSASMAIGERGRDIFAHAELLASSDANAERLKKILEGLTAMLGLAETNDKQLAEFLNSVAVTREQNTVTLDLAYSSARLAQMLKAIRTDAPPARRQPTITLGTVLAQWGGDATGEAGSGASPGQRTIENVKLANGSLITLGRALNGAESARFVSIEITPASGAGGPMTFKPDFMRNLRGTMWQFPFPGTDGVYTLRVNYVPDAAGKAKFAVSLSEPKAVEARTK